MKLTFEVDTEKKSFKMSPMNGDTVKWFLDSFPLYMGAYYGAFIRQLNKDSGKHAGITEISDTAMQFTGACMSELNLNRGDVIDVEAKEVEEDPNRRVLMPTMPSRGESDCEGTANGRVYNH